jgi:hypothetical protein
MSTLDNSTKGAHIACEILVRMIQRRGGPGFLLKSRPSMFHDLHGNVPVESRIPCAVDLSHASRAERRQDFVGAEFVTRLRADRSQVIRPAALAFAPGYLCPHRIQAFSPQTAELIVGATLGTSIV